MAYADPNSVHVPGSNSPPAAWGGLVRSDITWLAGDAISGNAKPMCRVYSVGDRSVSTVTETAILFDGERYEVGGALHSTVTNSSRITVPSGGDGVYSIGATVAWVNSNTSGIRIVSIRLNGSTMIARTESLGTANSSAQTLSCDYKLAAGDYVETVVYQNSGALLAVAASSAFTPEMWCHWVGVG